MPESAGPNFRDDMVLPLRPPEASFPATWDYSQSPLGTKALYYCSPGIKFNVNLFSILVPIWGQLNANMMYLSSQGYLMPIAEPASVNLVSNADANLSTHLLLHLVFTWPPGWAVPVNGERRRERSPSAPSLITYVTSRK